MTILSAQLAESFLEVNPQSAKKMTPLLPCSRVAYNVSLWRVVIYFKYLMKKNQINVLETC